MLTPHEARQRLNHNRMSMRWCNDRREYRINYNERDQEHTAYYTDDLLDAALMGGKMRRNATAYA